MRTLPGVGSAVASSRSSEGSGLPGSLCPFPSRPEASSFAEMLSVCSSEGDSLGGTRSLVSPHGKEQVPGVSSLQGARVARHWMRGLADR